FAAGVYPSDSPREAAAVQDVLRAIRDVSMRHPHAEPTLVRTEAPPQPAPVEQEVAAIDDGLGAPSAASAIAVEEISIAPPAPTQAAPKPPAAKQPTVEVRPVSEEPDDDWLARQSAAIGSGAPALGVLAESAEDEPKAFVSTVRDELDPDLLPVFLT